MSTAFFALTAHRKTLVEPLVARDPSNRISKPKLRSAIFDYGQIRRFAAATLFNTGMRISVQR
jgi:hypothetical protein